MQNIEKHPRLSQYIEKIRGDGEVGIVWDWNEFIDVLNTVLDDAGKRAAPCERFCEATAFKSEIKRLRGAVRRYCEFNKDMPQYEKDTPVIKELFYISAQ